MEPFGKSKRVRIYVKEDHPSGGRPLQLGILELFRREDAQGATISPSEAIAPMLRGNHKVLAVTDASGQLDGVADRAGPRHGLTPHA